MNALIFSLGLMSALVLTGTAISIFALHRAHLLMRDLDHRRAEPVPAAVGVADTQDLRDALEAMAAQMHELRKDPPLAAEPGSLRPGLNLTKRSQALRMHRRGDAVEKIASMLEVPRQEIDLLLKVQRIVLSQV
jgi:hypothetical protein